MPPADAGVCPATRRWPEGRLTAAVRAAGATAVKELENVPTCLADSRHGMACEKGQVDFAPDVKASGDGVRYSGPPGPSAAPAFDCACGAPSCRGVVRGTDHLQDFVAGYGRHVSDHVARRRTAAANGAHHSGPGG